MSFFNVTTNQSSHWKSQEKILLRFFFIYFILQAVPLDCKFYAHFFSINWLRPSFYDLFSLSRYAPQFFSLTGFANWGVAALLALAGTIFWSVREKENNQYDTILYWLRVILRYRLAAGVIAYGLIKLFPLQMPYPSLSNLHTNYGDFQAWKIYFHTIGITQHYERFLGAIEILAGVLLLFRKTVTFGAGIILGFTGNVLAANIAYDAGEQVYSAYLVVIALFLFAYDVPRLYNLLALQRYTIASKFQPVFSTNGLKKLRAGLQIAFVLFVVLLGFATYANYARAPYKLPATPGIKGTYGFYNVREFRLNNQLIPYSTTDSSRWQNVIFEKWATISIKIAKPLLLDNSTGDAFHEKDIDRNFESAGVGGRRYFAYTSDTANHNIQLRNKNKNYSYETFSLHYQIVNDSTILVSGVNEKKDSISAVLDRINKKYMLFEGRRKPIKL
jgi:hypothetical protein